MNEFDHSPVSLDCVSVTPGTMERPDEPGDTIYANSCTSKAQNKRMLHNTYGGQIVAG